MRSVQEIEKLLDKSLADYMKYQRVPGIAAGIVLEGELVLEKGYGVRNISSKEPVAAKSMFHSASISKTFVVTSLMQLYERKLLDIDKHVTEYLPYFKLKDERYKEISIKQMMSHISGMPDIYDYEWEQPQYGEDALEKYIRSIYDLELLWNPGSEYSYSNLAYEILGDVIAKASGMSFEAYVRQNILEPLGMSESSFLITEVSKENMTSPHVLNLDNAVKVEVNKFYPYNRIHAPSSSLWSSVEELSRYAIANLNKGILGSFRLLSDKSYDMMWQPYAKTNKTETCVGLSWFMKSYKGVDLIFHTGGDTGYCSNIVLIPKHNAALTFYCNCDFINLNMITEHILDIMLGFEVQPLLNSAMLEIADIIAERGISAAAAYFDDIRVLHKDEYYIGEAEFNELAYGYLKNKKIDEAIAVLKMAISELPDAANLYDSLGEMYLKKGDREQAVLNYKKSLVLNPHNTTGIAALRNMGIKV